MEQEKDKALGGYTLIPDSISSIPATELSMIEKVLLCKVISLSKGRPCEMSNAAFASCFGISTRQVTEHIKALKAKTWIDVTGPRTKRYIKPTEKALYLWKKPSIEENLYRRNHLEKKPSRTIEGSLSNYRGFLLPKNIENIESIDISANQDLRKCAPSQKRKAEREGQAAKGELFSKFWKAYPKKRDKAKAQRAFLKIKDIEKVFPIMMQALEKQKASADWQKDSGQFIPYPTTWLNGERWEDVEQVDIQPPAQGPGRLTQADVDRMEQEREEQAARDEAEYLSRMEQQEGESGS
ncbi:hypothetical protein [Mitsuokella multacida]|uniref:hypothetical protein n=1 Tax=Mitsuokella multacida TaxID=52226 RepID=UPI00241E0266|nr:hypothetical protein [Mitsuokella multacida]